MNKKLTKNKIILILLILIIITGIIIISMLGFEKTAMYKEGTKIEVYLPKGYNKQDIMTIAKESFQSTNISFEEIEKLNQVAGIRISNYTQEELEAYKSNICTKYEIDKESLEIYEILVPTVRLSTIITPYMWPMLIVAVLSILYVAIKNIKSEDIIKKVLIYIASLILIMALYFSIILIFRIPFSVYTMPLALALYIISASIIAANIK